MADFSSASAVLRSPSLEKASTRTRTRTRSFRKQTAPNRFCRSRHRRQLSGKAVFLVLTIQFLERVAYFLALGHILPWFLSQTMDATAHKSLVRSLIEYVATPLMYPVAGWIGCAWMGRLRMAKCCLGVLWVGFSGFACAFVIISAVGNIPLGSWYCDSLVIILFVLIAVGSAGVQVNLIPFGADIVLYKTSEELSSYFYWNYWGRNLGEIALVVSFVCQRDPEYEHQYLAASSFIGAFALTLALLLIFLCGKWLTDDQERQNSPKLICNVLCCAFSAKRPRARSAFSFTDEVERPSRLDLAKLQHGGRFCAEEVEDVKTFLQLLLLLFSIGGALAVFTGITNVMAVQFQHMTDSYFNTLPKRLPFHCSPSTTSVWTFNVVMILIAIPIIDQCLHPCLRQYAPNMLKRFGISYVLLIISAGILCTYETIGHRMHTFSKNSCMFEREEEDNLNISAWLTLVPITFVSLGEIFLKVTALEFMYAQAPHSMRAMMVGLFYWVDGIFSTFAGLILLAFYKSVDSNSSFLQSSNPSCGFWYYFVFLVLGVVTLVLYMCVAKRYKNRIRGDLDNGQYYRL